MARIRLYIQPGYDMN